MSMAFNSPDPTLTTESVRRVMEKVTDGRQMEIWQWFFVEDTLETVKRKCSTDKELLHACSDIYVHCAPDSSWEDLACGLYYMEETAATEELRCYLNPKGW